MLTFFRKIIGLFNALAYVNNEIKPGLKMHSHKLCCTFPTGRNLF